LSRVGPWPNARGRLARASPPSASVFFPRALFCVNLLLLLSHAQVYKPTSPGQRGRITTARDGLWKGKPFKALTKGLTKSGGRNNRGRITVFHRGGGHKRKYGSCVVSQER
jgi:hypothetical protein